MTPCTAGQLACGFTVRRIYGPLAAVELDPRHATVFVSILEPISEAAALLLIGRFTSLEWKYSCRRGKSKHYHNVIRENHRVGPLSMRFLRESTLRTYSGAGPVGLELG